MSKTFNLRTASKLSGRKPAPFRLESHVTLGSSDKYNDPYEAEIMAHKLRDRYVVSVTITHDPVTTRVYSNSWLYKDMATCWDRFHQISDIVERARDFVEQEGLKTVLFQYVVKHNLSEVPSDIENVYETNIPNMRQAIDPSTRGNLIKNFPTVPFMTQSGPDQLDQVYSAVGCAENPLPKDDIRGESQLTIPQHLRSPISKFQEAAGITQSMFKGASNDKEIKTAAQEDSRRAFIQSVKDNAHEAIEHGKALAKKHYMAMTGADEEEADAFYHGVKAVCSDPNIVLNLSATSLLLFLANNEYKPVFENQSLLAKFNQFAARREQAERALGCFGMSPNYATVTLLAQGDRGYGKCAVKLENVAEDAVLLCGDSFRFRNPSRTDYEPNPKLAMYPFSAMADCKAAATIMGMSQHELAAGPAEALMNIMDPRREYGRCEALIFAPITPDHVSEIVTASVDTSKTIRKILMQMGRLMPVVTSADGPFPQIIYRPADKEMTDDPAIKMMPQRHFCIGDRIMTKPMASMASYPTIQGTIIDMVNGQVTVEWDDQNRSIFDMVEALSRLMDAPKDIVSNGGMVVYQLPGMDDETVLVLSAAGVDPVSLYSLATHNSPASASVQGGMEHMIKSMETLGLHAHLVRGFVPGSGDEAFSVKEWIEAQLATGARLVVDLSPEGLTIKAGDVEEYIHPHQQPRIEIE